MRKAQAFEARYFGQTLRQRDLETALAQLQQCDSLIDRLRQQTLLESDKITLGNIANEIYADGARIAYELSEVAFRHRKRFRALSFYFAEKSKAAVLLDAISDANAKSFAGLPAQVLEEENNLRSALALVYQKLARKPEEQEEKYLRETALELNRAYNDLIRSIEQQYPDYYNLKFNTTAPSIGQLQQQLPENTGVVSYFIDDYNNRRQLYIYTITSSNFYIRTRTLPETFDKLITGFRNSMYYLDDVSFIRFGRELHKLVMPVLPSRIRSLVVLPAGRLGIIPFEALLTRKVKPGSTTYAKLPYLVNRFDVRYDFSAALILQKKSAERAAVHQVALCAPINFPNMPGLPDLPGTAREIEALNQVFTDRHISTKVLLQRHASEAAFKNQPLHQFNIIHLATHGVVNEENPELSCIYLHPQSDAEDGSLYTGEIFNLKLQAELVALSACQTGLGKITRGEGVIGLSRALIYAGARQLLVSFWSVSDESTALLMSEFYRASLSPASPGFARALQQTKINMTRGPYAAPFYWAPFVLIGF